MAAQMLRLSSQEKIEIMESAKLIESNEGGGELDFERGIVEPNQDLSWLEVKEELQPPPHNNVKTIPYKDIENCKDTSASSRKRKRLERGEMDNRIISKRKTSKGFPKNIQMGKASKKDWNTDIRYRYSFIC